ncbi:MAG: hypothetical protein ACQEXK_09790 [Bacillota bacterium]
MVANYVKVWLKVKNSNKKLIQDDLPDSNIFKVIKEEEFELFTYKYF